MLYLSISNEHLGKLKVGVGNFRPIRENIRVHQNKTGIENAPVFNTGFPSLFDYIN